MATKRKISKKSDSTSTMAYTDSVLITTTIDAPDNQYFAVVEVPGTFITMDMDEEVILVLKGLVAKIM